MSKEFINEPKIYLGIDYGVNENDYSIATITLYYNNTLYVIYQTENKEEIKALDEISKVERLKAEALQRLEAIDNVKPNEALECLEVINNYGCGINDNMKFSEVFEKEYSTIKQALLKAQEQEKMLKILFEKRIDLESFYTSFIEGNYDYNFYDIHYGTYGLECLTEEEFELLKRYFEKNIQK